MTNVWEPPITPGYYDHTKLFELDPTVVISLGGRGLGKTNFWKRYAIYHYKNTGKKTIYMRRFKEELRDSMNSFLKDIVDGDKRLGELKLEMKKNYLLVDGEEVIHFMALSQSLNKKSVNYNDYDVLIFDEFLTLGYTVKGQAEHTFFNEVMETVFRRRPIHKIVLIANALATTSEYFKIFGFDKPINPNRRFQSPPHSDRVVCEVYKAKDFRTAKAESDLYQLIGSSAYSRYSIENEFIFEDKSNVIERKQLHKTLTVAFNLVIEGRKVTCYTYDTYRMYFTPYETNNKALYCFSKEDVQHGAIYLDGSSDLAMMLHTNLQSQMIQYEDIETKQTFLMIIKQFVRTFY